MLKGVLSDGTLAWRCFVLFGKRPWMKWLLVVLISLDFGKRVHRRNSYSSDSPLAGLGSLSNIALGAEFRSDTGPLEFNAVVFQLILAELLAQKLITVWAWLFFALNTTMTMSIVYKILYVARSASDLSYGRAR
jgi:hypothetical protein